MAEKNKESQASAARPQAGEAQAGEAQAGEAEAPLVEAPTPDASNYVVQPTSYVLPAQVQAKGGVPEGRFTEEVLKGSDEDFGGGEEAHPEENQAVPGIAEGDEVPDTTGRAANQALKKSR